MSQPPSSMKLALPPKPGFPGRPGVVHVLQTRPGPGGHTIIQQRSPSFKPITSIRPFSPPATNLPINTNTAIQYQRKPEMTIINPSAQFLPPGAAAAFAGFPAPGLTAGMQPMLGGAGTIPGSLGSFPGAPGTAGLASSRKPCNCTKSHCLKLYCECFAQGQLCQNCNCNNCMNNLAYEEERGRAIKMTLERNPTAFHPKIGRGEGERKHTKGCNCKRSGCLKNYCECYEAKISCSDLCRCQGCRNTEDSIERRSLMRLAAMGSLKSRQPASYKKHLVKPPPETLPHVFLTWEVIEATVSCLLAQADDAERHDFNIAVQERIIFEEFGRSIDRVIESASRAQVRSIASGGLVSAASVAAGNGSGDLGMSGRGGVGAAMANTVAADLIGEEESGDEDDDALDHTGGGHHHGHLMDSHHHHGDRHHGHDDDDDDDVDRDHDLVGDDEDEDDDDPVDDLDDDVELHSGGGRMVAGMRHHRGGVGGLSINEMQSVHPAASAVGRSGARGNRVRAPPRSRMVHVAPDDDDVDDLADLGDDSVYGGGSRVSHTPQPPPRPANVSRSGRRRHPPEHLIDEMDDGAPLSSGSRHQSRGQRFGASAARSNERYAPPPTSPQHSHHTRRSSSHHHHGHHDMDY